MDCPEVSARISAFIDGEQDPAVSRELSLHFRQCSGCREEFAAFSRVNALVKGLPRHELPALFVKEVVLKLGEMQAPRRSATLIQRAGTYLLSFFEKLFNLLDPASSPSTHALEEFNDVPTSFMGYAYFRILN